MKTVVLLIEKCRCGAEDSVCLEHKGCDRTRIAIEDIEKMSKLGRHSANKEWNIITVKAACVHPVL